MNKELTEFYTLFLKFLVDISLKFLFYKIVVLVASCPKCLDRSETVKQQEERAEGTPCLQTRTDAVTAYCSLLPAPIISPSHTSPHLTSLHWENRQRLSFPCIRASVRPPPGHQTSVGRFSTTTPNPPPTHPPSIPSIIDLAHVPRSSYVAVSQTLPFQSCRWLGMYGLCGGCW